MLDSLQLTADYQVATPVNWQDGQDVIIVPAVSDEDAKAKFPKGWKAPEALPAGDAAAQQVTGSPGHSDDATRAAHPGRVVAGLGPASASYGAAGPAGDRALRLRRHGGGLAAPRRAGLGLRSDQRGPARCSRPRRRPGSPGGARPRLRSRPHHGHAGRRLPRGRRSSASTPRTPSWPRPPGAGPARCRFQVADVTRTPLPGAPADLIYARFLVVHLPDPHAAVAALGRPAASGRRPGGGGTRTHRHRRRRLPPLSGAGLGGGGRPGRRSLRRPAPGRGAPAPVPPRWCCAGRTPLDVPAGRAATIFSLNLGIWGDDPAVGAVAARARRRPGRTPASAPARPVHRGHPVVDAPVRRAPSRIRL